MKFIRHKSRTHYEVLGVKKNASASEIRTAFLNLSKQLHPDTNSQDPTTHEKFVKLNEAYTVLSKHLTRNEYDMTLSRGYSIPNTTGFKVHRPPSSYSAYPRPGPSNTQYNHANQQYQQTWEERAEAEREKWRNYDPFEEGDLAKKKRKPGKNVKKETLALFVFLYSVGISLGVYTYYESKKLSDRQKSEAFTYAVAVRERRNAGHHIGKYDAHLEKFYKKDIDALEEQRAQQMDS